MASSFWVAQVCLARGKQPINWPTYKYLFVVTVRKRRGKGVDVQAVRLTPAWSLGGIGQVAQPFWASPTPRGLRKSSVFGNSILCLHTQSTQTGERKNERNDKILCWWSCLKKKTCALVFRHCWAPACEQRVSLDILRVAKKKVWWQSKCLTEVKCTFRYYNDEHLHKAGPKTVCAIWVHLEGMTWSSVSIKNFLYQEF